MSKEVFITLQEYDEYLTLLDKADYEWLKEKLCFKLEIAKKQMEDSDEKERSYYMGRYEALKQLKKEVEEREGSVLRLY